MSSQVITTGRPIGFNVVSGTAADRPYMHTRGNQ